MVYSARKRCGQQLAREAPVEADVVSTVPESATPAALGFAEEVRTTIPVSWLRVIQCQVTQFFRLKL